MQINHWSYVSDSVASRHHNTHRAKSLASWLSISRELKVICKLALKLTQALNEEASDPLSLESITWHLVLRYARCFDATSSGRSVALGIEHVQKLENPLYLSLHKGLIHRRNNTFGHPGDDCSCRLIMHLVADDQLRIVFDEEGPGPINDSDQADLIVCLCGALQNIVDEKIRRAQAAVEEELKPEFSTHVETLRSSAGKHANASQQALAFFSKVVDI